MAEETIKRQHVGGSKEEFEKNNGPKLVEAKPETKKETKKSAG